MVTPLAGVWIEIAASKLLPEPGVVTPLAGVWIEIYSHDVIQNNIESLPLRECGLK